MRWPVLTPWGRFSSEHSLASWTWACWRRRRGRFTYGIRWRKSSTSWSIYGKVILTLFVWNAWADDTGPKCHKIVPKISKLLNFTSLYLKSPWKCIWLISNTLRIGSDICEICVENLRVKKTSQIRQMIQNKEDGSYLIDIWFAL